MVPGFGRNHLAGGLLQAVQESDRMDLHRCGRIVHLFVPECPFGRPVRIGTGGQKKTSPLWACAISAWHSTPHGSRATFTSPRTASSTTARCRDSLPTWSTPACSTRTIKSGFRPPYFTTASANGSSASDARPTRKATRRTIRFPTSMKCRATRWTSPLRNGSRRYSS